MFGYDGRYSFGLQLLNTVVDFTRPTPARRDAPLHKQGRSERRGESYVGLYDEPLSDARTTQAAFFNG